MTAAPPAIAPDVLRPLFEAIEAYVSAGDAIDSYDAAVVAGKAVTRTPQEMADVVIDAENAVFVEMEKLVPIADGKWPWEVT